MIRRRATATERAQAAYALLSAILEQDEASTDDAHRRYELPGAVDQRAWGSVVAGCHSLATKPRFAAWSAFFPLARFFAIVDHILQNDRASCRARCMDLRPFRLTHYDACYRKLKINSRRKMPIRVRSNPFISSARLSGSISCEGYCTL